MNIRAKEFVSFIAAVMCIAVLAVVSGCGGGVGVGAPPVGNTENTGPSSFSGIHGITELIPTSDTGSGIPKIVYSFSSFTGGVGEIRSFDFTTNTDTSMVSTKGALELHGYSSQVDRIYFASATNFMGNVQMWQMSADGSSQKMIHSTRMVLYHFYDDFRKLAFFNYDDDLVTYMGLYNVRNETTSIINSNLAQGGVYFSPDGDYFAYMVLPGMSSVSIMKASDPEYNNVIYSDGDSNKPKWSPDGKYLGFLNLDSVMDSDYTLMVYDVANETVSQACSICDTVSGFEWSPDGTKIVFSSTEIESNIYILTLKTGVVKTIELSDYVTSLEVRDFSSDGNYLAYISLDKTAETLVAGCYSISEGKNYLSDYEFSYTGFSIPLGNLIFVE